MNPGTFPQINKEYKKLYIFLYSLGNKYKEYKEDAKIYIEYKSLKNSIRHPNCLSIGQNNYLKNLNRLQILSRSFFTFEVRKQKTVSKTSPLKKNLGKNVFFTTSLWEGRYFDISDSPQ